MVVRTNAVPTKASMASSRFGGGANFALALREFESVPRQRHAGSGRRGALITGSVAVE
jgi:hypothetical protein